MNHEKESHRVINLLEKKVLEATQRAVWAEIELVIVTEDMQSLVGQINAMEEKIERLERLERLIGKLPEAEPTDIDFEIEDDDTKKWR